MDIDPNDLFLRATRESQGQPIDEISHTTRAPGEGEPVDDARILEFGKGELVVDTGTYLGRPCVFICAAKTPGEVGTSVTGSAVKGVVS